MEEHGANIVALNCGTAWICRMRSWQWSGIEREQSAGDVQPNGGKPRL